MSASIVSINFPSATPKRAIRHSAEQFSRPHGLGTWTTMAFGLVFRVAFNGANMLGSPVMRFGFRSSSGGAYATNPSHYYSVSLSAATWTWDGVSSFSGITGNGDRSQNAGLGTWATGSGGYTVSNNANENYYNSYIVIVSKSAPTTSSGYLVNATGGSPGTLINNMILALNSGTRGAASGILGGSTIAGVAYTVDEATYGTLDEVFFNWNYAGQSMDVFWTGVARWA